MAKRRLAESSEAELLGLARERVRLPPGSRPALRYEPDADILSLRFSDSQPTHSDDDLERGLIFNYASQELVSIEILNLYGTFVS